MSLKATGVVQQKVSQMFDPRDALHDVKRLKFIDYGATFKLALYRVVASGIVVGAIMFVLNPSAEGFALILAGPFAIAIFVAIGLSCVIAGRFGVPFAGLGGFMAFLGVIGDPLLWYIEKRKPGFIPSVGFSMLNRPVLIIDRRS